MGRLVCVGSGKGGTGKTTFSANIGRALCGLSKTVLIIDTDCGLRSADLMLAGAERAVYNLGDLADGVCGRDEAVMSVGEGADFISASHAPLSADQVPRVCGVLEDLSKYYDFIIIDRPAGLDMSIENGIGEHETVIVASCDPLSIRSAAAYSELVSGEKKLVLNRFVPDRMKKHFIPDIDSIVDLTVATLLGVVPEDRLIFSALVRGTCPESGPAAFAFERIAKRLCGENVPLPKLKKLI